jgi:hypothetical protein
MCRIRPLFPAFFEQTSVDKAFEYRGQETLFSRSCDQPRAKLA